MEASAQLTMEELEEHVSTLRRGRKGGEKAFLSVSKSEVIDRLQRVQNESTTRQWVSHAFTRVNQPRFDPVSDGDAGEGQPLRVGVKESSVRAEGLSKWVTDAGKLVSALLDPVASKEVSGFERYKLLLSQPALNVVEDDGPAIVSLYPHRAPPEPTIEDPDLLDNKMAQLLTTSPHGRDSTGVALAPSALSNFEALSQCGDAMDELVCSHLFSESAPTPSNLTSQGKELVNCIATDEARCAHSVAAIREESWVVSVKVMAKLDVWALSRDTAQDSAKDLVKECSLIHANPPFTPASKRVAEALEAADAIKKPKQYSGNAREQKAHREAQKCAVIREVVGQWTSGLKELQAGWQRTFVQRSDSVIQSLARMSKPVWNSLADIRDRLASVDSSHSMYAEMASAVSTAEEAVKAAQKELDAAGQKLEQLALDTFARILEDIPGIVERMSSAGDTFDAMVAVLKEVKDKMARVETKVEKKCRSEAVKQLIATANGPHLLASGIAVLRASVLVESAIETRNQAANVAEVEKLREEYTVKATAIRKNFSSLDNLATRALALAVGAVVYEKTVASAEETREKERDAALLNNLGATEHGHPSSEKKQGADAAQDDGRTAKKKKKKKKKGKGGDDGSEGIELPPGMLPAVERPKVPARVQEPELSVMSNLPAQKEPTTEDVSAQRTDSNPNEPEGVTHSIVSSSFTTSEVATFSVIAGDVNSDASGMSADTAALLAEVHALRRRNFVLEADLASHKEMLAETRGMLAQATSLTAAYSRQLDQLSKRQQTSTSSHGFTSELVGIGQHDAVAPSAAPFSPSSLPNFQSPSGLFNGDPGLGPVGGLGPGLGSRAAESAPPSALPAMVLNQQARVPHGRGQNQIPRSTEAVPTSESALPHRDGRGGSGRGGTRHGHRRNRGRGGGKGTSRRIQAET